MAYELILLSNAYKELSEAKDWYNEQRENLGEEFRAEVNLEFDYIEKYPDHYQTKFSNLKLALVNRFPYAIYYQKDDNLVQITIYAILHTKRNPDVLLKRIK